MIFIVLCGSTSMEQRFFSLELIKKQDSGL